MERKRGALVGVAFAVLAVVLFVIARSPEVSQYQGVYSFYALAITFAAGAGILAMRFIGGGF